MGFGLALVLAGVLSGVVTPSGVEVERVVDNGSYQPPGLPGQFYIEHTVPLICDGTIVFAGITEFTINTALYAATSAGVEVVANVTTQIPGTDVTFQGAQEPACAGDRVLFAGSADVTPPVFLGRSIYSWRQGGEIELELAAGINFGSINAFTFLNPSADSGDFVVQAGLKQGGTLGGNGLVLKRRSSPPELIAQNLTLILPGQSAPPSTLARPQLRGSDVYFAAIQFPNSGLYRWSPKLGFLLLIDNHAFHPEIGGNFTGFGDWIVVEDGLIFEASYSGGGGLFHLHDDGRLQPRVVPGDLTTEGETIRQAGYVRGNGLFFSFVGSTVESPLLVDSAFVHMPDGRIQRILTQGETVEGRLVFTVNAGADHQEAAFMVEHGAPTFGGSIYRTSIVRGVADVPGLSAIGLAGLAVALAITGLSLTRRV